ncbi:protein suppressor of white apricot [Armigeres subalbatus]|uniref:protein suppressor of white apricot n=1 Tax=Armigeres subalbatus TaxID=124917 RepID=UPI002ED272C4
MQQHSGPSGGRSAGGMNNGDSGILRKPGIGGHHHHHHFFHQDNFADLLVFGYSCKVFRDDEKARFIDQGRHLIPWMGDNQLKIDRYDARGALHDLSQHEPPLGGYGNRFDCLPPAEQRAEQLCEEERYYSLYANEVEEEIQQEEKAKREAEAGAEIPFDYDAPPAPVVGPEPAAVGDDDENSLDPPFVAPTNFEIPSELDVPETMKEHAIIEKTAKFIASQDSQMEILLRAKQADNPQFGFLSPGGRLYRYYRHMLMAIKTNQYPEEVPEEEPNGADNAAQDAIETAEPSPEKPAVVVPAIKYKPSIDCAYTQLISKITGAPIPIKDTPSEDDLNMESASSNLPIQPSEVDLVPETAKPIVEVSKVSTGLAGLVQYDSDSDESGDEHASEKKEKKADPDMEKREITFSGKVPPEIFQHVIEKTATYVAKNGYSFEEALRTKNDPRFLFLRKDHEFYPFYAFRVRYLINPFEEVPKSPEKVTITREIENGTVVETPSIGIKTVNTAPVPVPAPQTQIQANKPGGAVCFSIKSKDDASVALKSNVAQELGGDEEEVVPLVEQKRENEKSKSPVSREKTPEVPEQTKQPSEEKDKVEEDVKVASSSSTPPPVAVTPPVEELKSSTPPLEDCKPVNTSSTSPDNNAGENASKDQKRLEDRIKDKLAVAAREKLASLAKEKQLQLERKKRASMFVSLINKTESDQPTDEPPAKKQTRETTPEEPPPAATPSSKNGLELLKNQFSDHDDDDGEEDDDGDEQEADGDGSSDSSELSVHSIPSGSDTPDSKQAPSSAEDDVVFVAENNGDRPSRSRTRSKSVSLSSTSKHKKRKHKHKSKSKKSKKKKSGGTSRSRSRSPSKKKRKRSRSRSKSSRRSRSRSPLEKDAKKKKKKSKKKSHKHSKTPRSSSSSRYHHRKEHREKNDRYSDY